MEKFQNKYRIQSSRAQWWDYGANGAYFITICTKNRQRYLGDIKNGQMFLTNLGVIADLLWHEIPSRNPWVKLGEFVVMPDHIHGILILAKDGSINNTGKNASLKPIKSNPCEAEKTFPKNLKMSSISPKPLAIPSIIRSYKSAVTKHANRLNFANGWQSRYYDQIIRSQVQFQNVTNYIKNNVANWK